MEIRFPIVGPLRGTVFLDSSNVTTETADIDFGSPHISVGPGLRYATPVGPVRFDVGWRVPGLQEIGERGDIKGTQGEAATAFGLPIAIDIAIGEAF